MDRELCWNRSGGSPGCKKAIKADFQHYIITRFNVRLEAPGRIGTASRENRLDGIWLERRLELFKRFYLPSIGNQSCERFSLLLLIDPETPRAFATELMSAVKRLDRKAYVIHSQADIATTSRLFALKQRSTAKYLITTRVDSDDGLHRDHTRLVQENFAKQTYCFVAFPRGYSYSTQTGQIKALEFPENQFASLIEIFTESSTTVYRDNHVLLRKWGPIIMVNKIRGWLEVFHGGNLLNYHRGEDVPEAGKEGVLRDFAI